MSLWTIENTGDQLTLDDTLTMGRHRAELERDARRFYDGRHPPVECIRLGIYRVRGEHYTLETIGRSPLEALQLAARGDWREAAARGAGV